MKVILPNQNVDLSIYYGNKSWYLYKVIFCCLNFKILLAQLAGAVEYTDCFSAER